MGRTLGFFESFPFLRMGSRPWAFVGSAALSGVASSCVTFSRSQMTQTNHLPLLSHSRCLASTSRDPLVGLQGPPFHLIAAAGLFLSMAYMSAAVNRCWSSLVVSPPTEKEKSEPPSAQPSKQPRCLPRSEAGTSIRLPLPCLGRTSL